MRIFHDQYPIPFLILEFLPQSLRCGVGSTRTNTNSDLTYFSVFSSHSVPNLRNWFKSCRCNRLYSFKFDIKYCINLNTLKINAPNRTTKSRIIVKNVLQLLNFIAIQPTTEIHSYYFLIIMTYILFLVTQIRSKITYNFMS